MKKKLIIVAIIIVIIAIAVLLVLMYNKDSNKLKRYLSKNDYSCNSSVCSKVDKDISYQINFKENVYLYDDIDKTIEIGTSRTLVSSKTDAELVCIFSKENVKGLTIFTSDDTSNECLTFLEKVNEEVEKYQSLLFKAGIDINSFGK